MTRGRVRASLGAGSFGDIFDRKGIRKMEKQFYLDKIRGCWFGKCLAGAVGMPFEGVPFTVEMEEKDIHLSDVPNDDLEMQLIWMDALKRFGTGLTSRDLGDVWMERIPHGCDEYSVAVHNLRHGLRPPATGRCNNFFHDGMGATIRSEIWALVFPERPDAAGYFAQQDAEVDHWGDGVRCEIFMAMAEAHACCHSDIEGALRFALAHIGDRSSRTFRTLNRLFEAYDSGVPESAARDRLLLTVQRNSNFTDCVMNLCFIVHSLLYGKGDFLETVLSAVRFGRDTDCTAASCGAFLGIAKGMAAFPERWRSCVADRLSLSDYVSCIPGVPLTLTALIERTAELHEALSPLLRAGTYSSYVPWEPEAPMPETTHAEWLILDAARCDAAAVEKELRETGKCPESLRSRIVPFSTFVMDLSEFADRAGTLHLFSFLHVENAGVNPEEIVFSATADVGMTVWMDGRRLMNCHNRQKMLPSFHRAEGGSAFSLPLQPGSTHLFHVTLYNCLPPLRTCLMFGNLFNDHLDGFRFSPDA